MQNQREREWGGDRGRAAFGLAAACALALGAGAAEAQKGPRRPRNLEDCYLNVAMQKSTPDMVYLAKEICDAAFGRSPRSLAVLDPRTSVCEEWWFDANGRHETADRYCSLERNGDRRWRFACQWKKTKGNRITYAELEEQGDRLQPVGGVEGVKVGLLFRSLAGCVEHKARPAAP